jgi:hypothetical protein
MLHVVELGQGERMAVDPHFVSFVMEMEFKGQKACMVTLANGFQLVLADPDRELLDAMQAASIGA